MTKGKNDTAPKASASNTLTIEARAGDDKKALLARNVLRPSVRAAVTTEAFTKVFGELDINALVDELAAQARISGDGDLRRAEAMLVAQAHTLEAIFHELTRRAALNLGEYINAAEIYMRLALKAQSQCRATIETLALIKNPPPVTFVRETENQPNKLLEQQHGERLDGGTAQATVGVDSAMAAVGEVHRATDLGR
jgi:hypothetical protein